jgi:hypothetical protein
MHAAAPSTVGSNTSHVRPAHVGTFGGAGVPSYILQPEPRATRMTVNVPVECDKQPRTLRLRVDVSHPQRGGSVPFAVEVGPSDVGVRMSPSR